jgi:mono/diheme cytochrome c family protein
MTTRFAFLIGALAVVGIVGAGQANGVLLAQPPRTTWSGVYSVGQAQRGDAIFADHCASCHGTDLSGGGFTPALVGTAFTANWDNLTLDDLLDRIRTTMPQDKPGTLSRQQNTDLVAFILNKGGFPAGDAELPYQAELQKQIVFTATKP